MAISIGIVWKGSRSIDSRELRRDIVMIVKGVPVTEDIVDDINTVKGAVYDFVGDFYKDAWAG